MKPCSSTQETIQTRRERGNFGLAGHALSVAGRGAGQKHQSKFAELHLVAVRQHRPVHRFTVDVRAVEAADVDNLERRLPTGTRRAGG